MLNQSGQDQPKRHKRNKPKQRLLGLNTGIYGKGIYKVPAGHLRYSSPKELRNKYVHRVIVERLIEETPYSIRLFIPWPYEVHHADYNKLNNEPSNFILLSESLHSKLTADRDTRRKFHPNWQPEPAWMLPF